MKIPVHFDMETSDPDDVMTLALLATHPRAELLGVTITPGGPDQVSLVRYVLECLGKPTLVGSGTPKPGKKHVSEFHYKWFPELREYQDQVGLALAADYACSAMSSVKHPVSK